jgi:hypothetical protein
MATILRPTTELVAVAWLKSALGMSGVATQLPEDNASWAASGFATVTGVGGSASIDVPQYAPVVSVDAWACAPSSNKAPWGKALNLLETVRAASYDRSLMGLIVELPGGFPPAMVQTAYFVSEPLRVPDEASYAHYSANLAMHWRPT